MGYMYMINYPLIALHIPSGTVAIADRFCIVNSDICLKVLCHSISADCLLIKAARAHSVMNTERGGLLISLCVRSNLPAEAHSAR